MVEPAEEPLSRAITIRVTETFYLEIQRRAKLEHRKVADWCRLKLAEEVALLTMEERRAKKKTS